jgi:O-methyltransferase
VLIVDDYGHWAGAPAAVDRYFGESAKPLLLNRIDYTGRIGVRVE